MTNTEKIANAKKRIDELERLIKYWNNSEHDEPKIVDFSMKIEKIANAKKRIDELERLIKYWNDSEHDGAKIENFSMKIDNKVA